MIKDLDTYDWGEVFGCCGEEGHYNLVLPVLIEESTPMAGTAGPVGREDVEEILHSREGERDEADWLIVCRLKDGRFLFVKAGCDYTGWDCQSGGESWIAPTLDLLVRFGLGREERECLGLPCLEEEK